MGAEARLGSVGNCPKFQGFSEGPEQPLKEEGGSCSQKYILYIVLGFKKKKTSLPLSILCVIACFFTYLYIINIFFVKNNYLLIYLGTNPVAQTDSKEFICNVDSLKNWK